MIQAALDGGKVNINKHLKAQLFHYMHVEVYFYHSQQTVPRAVAHIKSLSKGALSVNFLFDRDRTKCTT